jgi:hypothetical protein
MVIVALLLLSLLCLFPTLIDSLGIVVENSGDDRHHVSLDNAGANVFRASNADIDNTLEGKIPLPHSHHVLATALFQNADEALDAAIHGEDVADASGGCGEIGEMVERVDEGECRGAVESTAII